MEELEAKDQDNILTASGNTNKKITSKSKENQKDTISKMCHT
jgi:hypothetical protein